MRRRIVPYNAANEKLTQLANASCLISGNCSAISNQVVTRFIASSYGARNTSVIVMDFTDHDMDAVFHGSNYEVTSFDIDTDVCGYDPFYDGDVGQAVRYIKQKATTFGYPHDQTVQIIKYISLLQTINEQLGLRYESLREMNHYYDSVERIGEALEELVRKQKIRPSDMKSYLLMLQRSAKGNLLIDNILSECDFTLGTAPESGFSIKQLPSHTLCHLYVNSVYADKTAVMLETLRKDIADIHYPVNVIICTGKVPCADNLFDLASCVTTHTRYNLLYITDDIFSDTKQYEQFRKLYEINVFGAHNGESSVAISGLFGTRRVLEEHYGKTIDRRLTANTVFDTLTGRNYAEGTQYVPAEIPYFRPEYVASMPDNKAIVVNTKGNAYSTITLY